MPLPRPPDGTLNLLPDTWDRGRPIHRCGGRHHGNQPYPSPTPARFSPFTDPDGQIVPTLYGAATEQGALSESVFHDIPGGGGAVDASRLQGRRLFRLVPTRDLTLAAFTSHGLRRLGLTRVGMIESGPRHYGETTAWAQAVHRDPARVWDGITWMSRQDDTSQAVVLFGDRVSEPDLQLAESDGSPLDAGRAFDRIARLAADLDIVIIGLPFH